MEVVNPDGMAIDADGNLWIAQWGEGCVSQWSPVTGKLLRRLEVPGAKLVTSCAFGGPDLSTLYIPTASWRLTPEDNQVQ